MCFYPYLSIYLGVSRKPSLSISRVGIAFYNSPLYELYDSPFEGIYYGYAIVLGLLLSALFWFILTVFPPILLITLVVGVLLDFRWFI